MDASPRQCPSLEVWAEFPAHVADDERERLRAHLGQCDDCRTLVSDLVRHAGSLIDTGDDDHLAGNDALDELPERDASSYVIEREYGRGGLGRVYAVRDRRLGRTIAVKELLTSRPDLNRRFAREALITSRLEHPGIVPVYEAGTWRDGQPYYAMKLVRGPSLLDLLRARPGFTERLPLVANVLAVADAMAYAHSRGVIHRDLKPANVIVGSYGETIVIDWGLAKEVGGAEIVATASDDVDADAGDDVTRAGSVLGTPAYMPPEQARGDEVDQRADVYALGAMLYHVITGEAPRPSPGEPLRLPADSPVRADLAAIVHKAIAPEPGERYADAGELRGDLQRYQAGQLVSAHSYPWYQRAGRFVRRRSKLLALASAAFIAIGAGARYGYARHAEERAIARCDARSGSIDAVWNASVRQAMAGGDPEAAALVARVDPWFERQAAAWKRDARAACIAATVRGTWDARRAAKASWCLEDRRLQMAALVERLADPGVDVARKAVTAAAGMSPTDVCIDERALAGMADAPPPASRAAVESIRALVAEAASLEATGQYELGLERAERALALAEDAGVPSALASAQESKASLLHELGRYDEATELGQRAYLTAARSETWDVAASVASELIFYTGHSQGRPDEGRAWAEHASVAIALAGDPLELREAGRLTNLCVVRGTSGDHVGALEAAERTVEIRERALGPEHPDLASSLNNAGNGHLSLGHYETAESYYRRSAAIKAAYLGDEHPSTVSTLENVGRVLMKRGAFEEAEALLEQCVVRREAALGAEHPAVAISLINLGTVKLALEAPLEARPLFERARAIHRKTLEPGHWFFAQSGHGIGESLRLLGAHAEARAELERTMNEVPTPAHELRAQLRFSLARSLWDAPPAPGARARAVALAREALDLLLEARAEPDLQRRVEAWLAANAPRAER